MEPTRITLLQRMKSGDPNRAWEDFYNYYWGAILRYAAKLGLNETLARDVLQESMITLMTVLPTFEYDPARGRFRNFLLTIVHRKALKFLRRKSARVEVSIDAPLTDDGMSLIDVLPSGEDGHPGAEADRRWMISIVEDCLARMREEPGMDPKSVEIFVDYVVNGESPQEVARKYGEDVNNVYQIKSRLTKALKKRLSDLLSDDPT
jgi:RNA polymerase sigma factor (sigma-70 family)